MKRVYGATAVFCVFLLALAGPVAAADYNWTNGVGGNFDVSGNWNPNAMPVTTDQTFFNTSATYQVTWTAGATNQKAFFSSVTGTVTLAIGSGNTWFVTNGMEVGQTSGSTGTVRMTGGTLTVTNVANTNVLGELWGNAILELGEVGRGSLTLEGGTTTVNELDMGMATSFNSLLVTGTNTLLYLGRPNQSSIRMGVSGGGNSTITITNGARVIVNGSGNKADPGNLWGIDIAGQNQKILVSGTNSFLWVTNNSFAISAHDSEMSFSGGATGQFDHGSTFSAGSNSVIRATGSGTLLKTSVGTAGIAGKNNQFIVANGAQCKLANYLGVASGGNSYFLIYGTGTVVTAVNDIYAYSDDETPCVIVSNGASLACGEAGTSARLANTAGKKGIMIVTGSGTIWTNTGGSGTTVLHVGQGANTLGRLTIRDGATAYAPSTYIASGAGSTGSVTVTDSGTLWTNSWGVQVGSGAGSTGTLIVSNNASAYATNILVGTAPTNMGTLRVVAGGTLRCANTAGSGLLDHRQGSLTLDSAGTITVDWFYATNGAGSAVAFNGGTMNVKLSQVANGAAFTVGNGTTAATLNLTGGTNTFANGLSLSANGTLTGSGTIAGSVSGTGRVLANIGGATQGSGYNYLKVNGTATLTGNAFAFQMQNGYLPGGSVIFTNLNATSVSGTFAGLPDGSRAYSSNFSFRINYSATDVTLTDFWEIKHPAILIQLK